MDEVGIDVQTNKPIVRIDPNYFRPAEVECVFPLSSSHSFFRVQTSPSRLLLGNPAKAEKLLGWKRKVDFKSLVREMVEADVKAAGSLVEDQN